MTRTRSFTTAAARRSADPLVWEVDGVEVKLRPSVDFIQVAQLIEALSPNGSEEATAATLVARIRAVRELILEFVAEDSVDAFQSVAASLDAPTLSEMASELISEYSGTNPTKQPS